MTPTDCAPVHLHRSFDDPVPYHAAIQGGGSLFSVLRGGAFRAELTTVRIGRVTLQRGREDLPRLGSSGLAPNRVGLLGWYSNTPLPVVRGAQAEPGHWLFLGPGMESHHRSFGPVDFVVLTLDEQDVADAAFEITGRTLTVAPGTLLRPPPELDAQLMAVIGSAIHSAQMTPAVFSASMAVKALELDLLRLMIACCSHGEALRETVWRRERAAVAKRFEAAVEANGHQPMLVSDLCRSIGVTQRTLSNVCREQLSLSPQKYLTLRRLHMSREALLRLDRHSATVTQIATDFGFWELGRFSANYKAMFGELPSETLRRSSSPARK